MLLATAEERDVAGGHAQGCLSLPHFHPSFGRSSPFTLTDVVCSSKMLRSRRTSQACKTGEPSPSSPSWFCLACCFSYMFCLSQLSWPQPSKTGPTAGSTYVDCCNRCAAPLLRPPLGRVALLLLPAPGFCCASAFCSSPCLGNWPACCFQRCQGFLRRKSFPLCHAVSLTSSTYPRVAPWLPKTKK